MVPWPRLVASFSEPRLRAVLTWLPPARRAVATSLGRPWCRGCRRSATSRLVARARPAPGVIAAELPGNASYRVVDERFVATHTWDWPCVDHQRWPTFARLLEVGVDEASPTAPSLRDFLIARPGPSLSSRRWCARAED